MSLWSEFLRCLLALRSACTRGRTFAWMVLVVAGFAARPDLAGVTSFVRGGWLRAAAYQRLLGWTYFKKAPPEIEKAVEHLEQALALDPSDTETADRIGMIRDAG